MTDLLEPLAFSLTHLWPVLVGIAFLCGLSLVLASLVGRVIGHDTPTFPRCGCARCATTTGDLPADMRMEK